MINLTVFRYHCWPLLVIFMMISGVLHYIPVIEFVQKLVLSVPFSKDAQESVSLVNSQLSLNHN